LYLCILLANEVVKSDNPESRKPSGRFWIIRGMTVAPAAERKLGSFSTTAERVEALIEILDGPLVARAAHVTSTAVRNWMEGAEPRTDAAMTLDDLRLVVAVLLDGGFEPERIKSWLLSRNVDWLEAKRPIDEISQTPGLVHAAANDAVAVHRFGLAAAASAEAGPLSVRPEEDD
jgi:hypothetical protein